MITVEIVRQNGSSITSLPLDTSKNEFLQVLLDDDFVDFPALDRDGKKATFCFSTDLVLDQCALIFREVE